MQDAQSPAYLTIARIGGDPEQLLDGYFRASETMDGVGRDHNLILHAAAPTDAGLLIVNLWPSKDGSEAAARDQRRLETVRQQDLDPEQIRKEHHDVARLVLFGAD
jgi:hypothetical protein